MLFHISEDPNIKEFLPRKSDLYVDLPPIVWGMDEKHLINYYFPRDCPRIIYRYSLDITEEDKIKYFSNTNSETIITLENCWYNILNKTILYKYIFGKEKFRLFDDIAGYYISEEKIEPKSIIRIDKIMEKLIEENVEVRFTPTLFPLRDSLIKSSIKDYSIIRFKNAKEISK
jgi:hypothetical protein